MRSRLLIFVMLLSALMLLAVFSVSSAQGPPPGLARAREVQERNTNALIANPDVVGTAVTVNPGGQAAVVILTTREGVAGLPGQIEGVPVVVSVTGEIFARCHQGIRHNNGEPCGGGGDTEPPPPEDGCPTDTTARARPACIGMSTGHPSITAGTIGARVTNGAGVFALSNNHVYAATNTASIGDAVIQPGSFDGGTSPADNIGTLAAFEFIRPGDCSTNTDNRNVIDAAIASTSTDLVGNSTPPNGYGTPSSATVEAELRMRVMKYGRTTGQTSGRVDAINAIVNINYGSFIACFERQILIRPGNFSAGGDSGSLIVTEAGRNPVGLLFAGSSSVTVANPINAVLGRFGVGIDGA